MITNYLFNKHTIVYTFYFNWNIYIHSSTMGGTDSKIDPDLMEPIQKAVDQSGARIPLDYAVSYLTLFINIIL